MLTQRGRSGIEPELSVPAEQCRALVDRILESDEFRRTSRLRDFLRYVVERKLAGAPQDVTEVLIGQAVFGRPASYNPGEDSIVRTEARSLRQRLERYFSSDGSDEPFVLEIPRGGYLPIFRPRNPPDAEVAPSPGSPFTRRRILWATGGLAASLTAIWVAVSRQRDPAAVRNTSGRPAGAVELESSDPRLVRSFQGAKQRALAFAYTGDPVGDWYDSTAGNRYAFCMRDASHQSAGAAVLGLSGHTLNMMRRFAASIALSRDWCGFWEINKDGFPAPVDYKDDADFWYCLPANFDVLQTCYRQFLWTNDAAYFDSVFSNFYDRTVTSYVAAWDRDHDGVMESPLKPRRRGMASYYQEDPVVLVGADMLAAQYAGYLAYASIQERKGVAGSLSNKLAEQYRSKAQALKIRYSAEWWNELQNRYYSSILPDRRYYSDYVADTNMFSLLFGITEEGLKTEAALDSLEKIRPRYDQTMSYFPEVLYQYGRNDVAYQFLLELTDPGFRSRGMPEIAYAVVGAVATGMMGFAPDAPHATLETLPRLPASVEWVRLARVPVLSNEVTVRHRGVSETAFTNVSGPLVHWKVCFPVARAQRTAHIVVDGAPVPASFEQRANRQVVVSAVVPVKPGQTRTSHYRPAERTAAGFRGLPPTL